MDLGGVPGCDVTSTMYCDTQRVRKILNAIETLSDDIEKISARLALLRHRLQHDFDIYGINGPKGTLEEAELLSRSFEHFGF